MMFRRRLIGYLALLIAFLIASLGVTPTPQPRPASVGKPIPICCGACIG